MNYFTQAKECIELLMRKGIKKYAIYPYGEKGAMVKGILEDIFDIYNAKIFDNILCEKYNNILKIDEADKHIDSDTVVLIASDNIACYQEIRKMLFRCVDKQRCIELFPIPLEIEEGTRMYDTIIAAKEKGMGYFSPKNINSKFFIPFWGTDLIQNTIFMTENYFEKDLLNNVSFVYLDGTIGKKIYGGCVLDIGANIGNHTLFYCKECHAKKVYSFEPINATFEILKENIRINGLEESVIANNFGIGQQTCKASVGKINMSNIGGTGLVDDCAGGNIQIFSLDELGIDEQVDFVKIDVEGMEEKVFLGGRKFFTKQHPYIQVESFPINYGKVSNLLNSMGYQCIEQIGENDYLFL